MPTATVPPLAFPVCASCGPAAEVGAAAIDAGVDPGVDAVVTDGAVVEEPTVVAVDGAVAAFTTITPCMTA